MRSLGSPCSNRFGAGLDADRSRGVVDVGQEVGAHLDDLIGERQHAVVVRRHDDDPAAVGEAANEAKHAFDLDVVEVGGGLVGQDQRRVERRAPWRSRRAAAGRR